MGSTPYLDLSPYPDNGPREYDAKRRTPHNHTLHISSVLPIRLTQLTPICCGWDPLGVSDHGPT